MSVESKIGLVAPVYSGHSSLSEWIELAESEHDPNAWGTSYELACAYWVAHHIASTPGGEGSESVAVVGGETVASIATGGMSVSFSSASAVREGDGHFASTFYGRKWLELRGKLPNAAPFLVGLL